MEARFVTPENTVPALKYRVRNFKFMKELNFKFSSTKILSFSFLIQEKITKSVISRTLKGFEQS